MKGCDIMENSLLEHLTTLEKEVIKMKNGEKTNLKKMTISVVEPPEYNQDKIITLRKKLSLTQKTFALILGVSSRTVESWERGATKPKANSERLMSFFDNDPSLVDQILISK